MKKVKIIPPLLIAVLSVFYAFMASADVSPEENFIKDKYATQIPIDTENIRFLY